MVPVRRILLLALSLGTVLPAALPVPPAAAQDGFEALRAEFLERIPMQGEGAGRAALVARVASFDTADAGRLLGAGLASLVDRFDRDEDAREALRKRYEEVNVPDDVMKDNYKTRTELQNAMVKADERLREDRKVFEAFHAAIGRLKDVKSLSALSTEVKKFKSVTGKEVAAEGFGAAPAGMETALRLAKDGGPRVAAAALRGLRGRNEDPVFDYAKACLKDEWWPVRLEAVLTLEKVNQPRVLPPLIEALAREEGRLRDDVRDALRRLTSQNFDADPEAWRMWWVDNHKDLEDKGGGTALFGSFKGKAPSPEKKSVYGIESRSRKILFIIDTSGSMKHPITKAKGTATGLSADETEEMNMTKLELAQRELKRAIRSLEPEASFNIVSFGTHVVKWKPKMGKGDMTTKNEAYAFVRDLEAAGGTWAYGAFMEAFQMAGMGAYDKNYDPVMDTVYFISDGAPTDNDMDKPAAVDPETVLAAVREWNRLGKLTIHAIAIDPKTGGGAFIGFMKKLAAQNNGQYTQRE
jgi:uncharacterized protein YegL